MTDVVVNKGKSVRATSLVAGNDYVMCSWLKERTYRQVRFLGYMSSFEPVTPIPQLKGMTVDNKFYFQSGDELLVADGRTPGNLFMGEGAGHRVTFSEVGGAAASETPAETLAEVQSEASAEG